MDKGISFAGDGAADVSLNVSSAEASNANGSGPGPIDSPVPSEGAESHNNSEQKYSCTPTVDGKGIEFTEGTSKD